ncbi:MAG: DUF4040 domain-containing protein [Acaryochloridaceae cyanobacterium RL_2_7]|nr:DUF4040 domain-containing protein [Acaryochloridaceae cyanobacterium RL_2_7]
MTFWSNSLESADIIAFVIVALMPISAAMLLTQKNPYQALVLRGILGAIAALVYALFGAADVALTEALVGTMLSTLLYGVAVRSSMTMRLGYLRDFPIKEQKAELITPIKSLLNPYQLRLELYPYDTVKDLQEAYEAEDIHSVLHTVDKAVENSASPYLLQTRLQSIYDILHHPSLEAIAQVSYAPSIQSQEK